MNTWHKTRALVLPPLTFILLGSGCAKYKALDVNPVASEAKIRARAVPPRLDANSLIAVAVANSGEAAVARARLAEAEAASITAHQRINPSLSGEGGYNRTPDSTVTDSVAAGFTIETAGKRGLRMLVARKNVEAARIAVAEAEWHARSRVRAALVKYYFARQRLESLKAESQIRDEIVGMFSVRFEAGEASRPELDAVRAEQASIRLSVRTAEGDLADSLAGIAAASEIPVASFEGKGFELESFRSPPGAEVLPLRSVEKAGLLHRADIRRTLVEYEAADGRLRLELANQYPNITLSPAYTFQEGFPAYTLGAALESLPVFHRQTGPIAEADAARREVQARFTALQAQAIAETESALRQYTAALSQAAAARDGIETVQRQRETATAISLKAGESDRFDMAQARLAAVAAARLRVDALERAEVALGALEDAVQANLAGETMD